MNPLVEIVIINWRRPGNVKELIPAARKQTIPVKVTLIDAHAEDRYALPAETLEQCDTAFKLAHNYGGWNRFVPMGGFTCKYTLLVDDDVGFSEQLAAHFVEAAARMPKFAMLGLKGRRWPAGNYVNEDIERSAHAFEPVDCLIRVYFVPTHLLGYAVVDAPLYSDLPFIGHHDDILACAALTRHTGLRCYLTPSGLRAEPEMKWETLPQNDAQYQRPMADQERIVVTERAVATGYPLLYP